jgi:hypothetical protein
MGLEMQDGSRYNASRTGRLDVDRPDHVREIMRRSEESGGTISRAIYTAAAESTSRFCPACKFIGYAWQRECPKCQGPMQAGRPPRSTREAGGVSVQP